MRSADVLVALAALALFACGSSGDRSGAVPPHTLGASGSPPPAGPAGLLASAERRPARFDGSGYLIAPTRPVASAEARPVAQALEATAPVDALSPLTLRTSGVVVRVHREHATAALAKLQRGAVVYEGAWPSVDAQVFAKERSVEEMLVARAGVREVLYRIELPPGYRLTKPVPSLNLVEVRDARGTARLRALAAAAWDQKGEPISVQLVVDRDRLVVRIPKGVNYPVTIDPEWATTGDLALARTGHTATLLPDGKVLICGGDSLNVGLSELYDPLTETFSASGALLQPRTFHTATLLQNGKVLVVGGSTIPKSPGAKAALAEAELYDPALGTFSSVASPPAYARTNHAATLLPGGSVMLTGGVSALDDPTEVFDPTSESFSERKRLAYPRKGHSATLLPTGNVLIVGGGPAQELLDPYTGASTTVGGFTGSAAALLPSGSVALDGEIFDVKSQLATALNCHGEVVTGLPSGDALYSGPLGLSVYHPHAAATSSPPPPGCDPAATPIALPAGTTATLLPTGAVLFVGGTTAATLFAQNTETRASLGGLDAPRVHHAAALLPSGKVLLVGGAQDSAHPNSAEIVDPALGVTKPISGTKSAFGRASATTLSSGLVYVAGSDPPPTSVDGGLPGPPLDPPALELFDPATQTFSVAGAQTTLVDRVFAVSDNYLVLTSGSQAYAFDVTAGRTLPSVSLNTDYWAGASRSEGQLILAGSPSKTTASLVEIGNAPSPQLHTGTIQLQQVYEFPTVTALGGGDTLIVEGNRASIITTTDVGNPLSGPSHYRHDHSATLLPSGDVLVAGGTDEANQPVASTEIYDAKAKGFRPAASLNVARAGHTATLLRSGSVLVAGDSSMELYDPRSDTWTPAEAPGREGDSATVLPSGKVLLAGGNGSDAKPSPATELYDPATHDTVDAAPLLSPRADHTATLLPSGYVLFAGGDDAGTAEIFDHLAGTFRRAANLHTPRSHHSATLLPSGRVLVTGGTEAGKPSSDVEQYDPTSDTWIAEPALSVPRSGHSVVLLPTGKVLVAGGATSGNAALEVYDPVASASGSASKVVDGALPSGQFSMVLLPSGDVLVSGAGATFRFDSATSSIAEPRAGPTEAFGGTFLGFGGTLLCAGASCDHRHGQNQDGESVPHIACATASLTKLSDESVLLRGRTPAGRGYALQYGVVPQGVVRPRIASPGLVTAGTEVTIRGAGFMNQTAVGSTGEASRPELFPVLYFVPAETGTPIASEVLAWTPDTVRWKVPKTPYHGPGWLHAVVQGVPSDGAFVVVSPTPRGSACASDSECVSERCVEGVCCDLGCEDGCQSCRADQTGAPDGTCSNIPAGKPARFGCDNRPADKCSPSGTCNGTGECAFPNPSPNCSTPSVPNGVCIAGACAEPPPSTCNEDRSSLMVSGGDTQPCGDYLCKEETSGGRKRARCLDACVSTEDCAPGLFCTSEARCHACTPDSLSVQLEGTTRTSCGNFLCRGGECLSKCSGAADCAPWAECRSGTCAVACDPTGEGVLVAPGDGKESTSCAPYRCWQGGCLSKCNSHADCAKTDRCDVSGHCTKDTLTAFRTPDEPSCACSTPARRRGGSASFPAVMALVLGLARGRRRRAALKKVAR